MAHHEGASADQWDEQAGSQTGAGPQSLADPRDAVTSRRADLDATRALLEARGDHSTLGLHRSHLHGLDTQRTSKVVLSSPVSPSFAHVTTIGQRPGVVLEPTRQRQPIRPLLSAVCGISPLARDGPDLYTTLIPQLAPGLVWISRVASLNGATGDESETR